MPFTQSMNDEFIEKMNSIIETNISNGQFGVTELASEIGMSRSNLHRRLKAIEDISISQFIRRVRLERAHSLLNDTNASITEITFECGFNSVSYFTKCFSDHYGYPPGKTKMQESRDMHTRKNLGEEDKGKWGIVRKFLLPVGLAFVPLVIGILVLSILRPFSTGDYSPEKSIAVLPFLNYSPDEEKMYFIDAIMESILDNLSKIEDLRVVSRTSVEQYRENPKPVSEISKEMNVSFILEGSGLKDGENIRLTVNLIDANRDEQIWSQDFNRKVEEQFAMLSEIPRLVAGEINVIITPEELERIERIPTNSLKAFELYQQGTERLYDWWANGDVAALKEAEDLFHSVLDIDDGFAEVYARLSSVYQSNWELGALDMDREEMLDSAISMANCALSIDDQCTEAYNEKGACLIQKGENENALDVLQKGLQYNPNYWESYFHLGEAYANLGQQDYALENYYKASMLHRGRMLPTLYENIAYFYANLGFEEQAQENFRSHLQLSGDSLSYYENMNRFSYVFHRFEEAIDYSEKGFELAPENFWFVQNLAMGNMFLGQFEESLKFFKLLEELMAETYFWTVHLHRLAYVYYQLGDFEKADVHFSQIIHLLSEAIEDGEVYFDAYYNLAGAYAFTGNRDEALEYLRIYKDGLPDRPYNELFWVVRFIKIDPLFDSLRDDSDFRDIVDEVEKRYRNEQELIRNWMLEHGLI